MTEQTLRLVFLIHLASTLFMTGLIWFVQVAHYPLFKNVGEAGFIAYQQLHMSRTTSVVGAPMIVELVTAIFLLWMAPARLEAWPLWVAFALLVAVWLTTFLVHVPQHDALSRAFDSEVHNRLVAFNWLRTIAWTVRSLLLLWMIWTLLAPSPAQAQTI